MKIRAIKTIFGSIFVYVFFRNTLLVFSRRRLVERFTYKHRLVGKSGRPLLIYQHYKGEPRHLSVWDNYEPLNWSKEIQPVEKAIKK